MEYKEIHGESRVKVGVVIPTMGNRPTFLNFVLDRMAHQTRKVDVLVIENKKKPYIDIVEKYQRGLNNLFNDGCDIAFLVEDDDFYPLNYIESMVSQWVNIGKPLVMGLNETIYYHLLSRKYKVFDNKRHCAAFTTLVSRDAKFNYICDPESPHFDIELYKANDHLFTSIDQIPIGIKHGLGNVGGRFHDSGLFNETDNELNYFKSIFDRDAQEFYLNNFVYEPSNVHGC